ncbi:hypothetical protein [Singulisphaera sp. PoT]|uniref:hypothetical protein n=1 Tax=Singulisphaera sp. PoT TaxID=3411797 RepID=UPI003BF492DE
MGQTATRLTDAEILGLVEQNDRRLAMGGKRVAGVHSKRRRSASIFGEEHGVSGKKIERTRYVVDYATEETKRGVRSGALTIYRAMVLTEVERTRPAAASTSPVGALQPAGTTGDSAGARSPLHSQAIAAMAAAVPVIRPASRPFRLDELPEEAKAELNKMLGPMKQIRPDAEEMTRAKRRIEASLRPMCLADAVAPAGASPAAPKAAPQADRVVLFEGTGNDGERCRLVLERIPDPNA